jgi:tetratricopeptide (TPR) repeat protein
VLTGGNRNALPHHQTLRALIEWSYELLTENERVLLCRSALFPGGFTIGGAVEVCADETLEEWDILDHLAALVDKSLVIADMSDDEPRYRMLESTREYALERLDESGSRNIVALKHAEYFLRLAQRADEAWPNVPAKAWLTPLTAELDNVRAALSWCVSQKNYPLLGIRIFDCLEAFWWDAQPIEGRRWIEELREIAQSDEASAEAGRYWLSAAGIALSAAKEKMALDAAEKALEIYRSLNDALGMACAQRCRGAALIRLGKLDEGEEATSDALQTFRDAGNNRLVAIALRTLATAPILRGDMEKAAAIYREALTLSQALQDERGVQIIAGNLAELEAHAGKYEDALEHAREALDIARARHEWVMVCTALINITAYLLVLDRLSDARSTARDALNVAVEIQSEIHLAVAIQHLAAVAATCGDAARAARLLGYTDAAYARLENSREPTEAREYERALTVLKERLPEETFSANVRAGSLLTAEQAKCEALLT